MGGKDPAYVRADADLAYTAAELVDGEENRFCVLSSSYSLKGAFFNSGQSCCAVEVRGCSRRHFSQRIDLLPQRIYVHESVYDTFVDKFVDIAKVSPGIRLLRTVRDLSFRVIG